MNAWLQNLREAFGREPAGSGAVLADWKRSLQNMVASIQHDDEAEKRKEASRTILREIQSRMAVRTRTASSVSMILYDNICFNGRDSMIRS